ncbi:uncharacterized protein LOC144439942 [Glandiceps talaboti]
MAFNFDELSGRGFFDENLQCPGCKEDLVNLKVLPCSHYFCYDCLLHIAVSLAGKLTCLTCGEPHRLPNGGVPALPDLRPWLGRARSRDSYISYDSSSIAADHMVTSPSNEYVYYGVPGAVRNDVEASSQVDSDINQEYTDTLRSKSGKLYANNENGVPQSPVTCELCDAMATSQCTTCQHKLCRNCTAKHRQSCYSEGQVVAKEAIESFQEPIRRHDYRAVHSIIDEIPDEETSSVFSDANVTSELPSFDISEEEQVKKEAIHATESIRNWAKKITAEVSRQERELVDKVMYHSSVVREKLRNQSLSNGHTGSTAIIPEYLMFGESREVLEMIQDVHIGSLTKTSLLSTDYNPNHIDINLNSLTSLEMSTTLKSSTLKYSKTAMIGGHDDQSAKLNVPVGVAMTTYGDCLVPDTLRGVMVFDNQYNYRYHFSVDDESEFEPRVIHLLKNDELAITDIEQGRVVLCNTQGRKRVEFGQTSLQAPLGISSVSNGQLYVTDVESHCIRIYDLNGRYWKSFGGYGSGDGHFRFPWSVAVNSLDDVIVSDYYNHRIQVFDSEGEFVFQFGKHGNGNGEFEYPRGVATDYRDNIYVCSNHKVQIFSATGKFIRCLGDGSDDLWYVTGVAVSQWKPSDVLVTHHLEKSLLSPSVVSVFSPFR